MNAQCPFPGITYDITSNDPSGTSGEIEVDVSYPFYNPSYIEGVDLVMHFDAPNGFDITNVSTNSSGSIYHNYNPSTKRLSIIYNAPRPDESLQEVFGFGTWLTFEVTGPQFADYEVVSSSMTVWANDDGGSWYYGCYASGSHSVDETFGPCDAGATGSISGNINKRGVTEDDLQGIKVDLYDEYGNFISTTQTNSSGNYSFSNLCQNADYDIRVNEYASDPACSLDDDDSNALFDKIIGYESTDEYYYMAADLNESNTVSAIDLLELNKVRDGISTLNINWLRFVTEDFAAYANSMNDYILKEDWHQSRIVSAGSSNVDFHAVDVGDVDVDCNDLTRASNYKYTKSLYYSYDLLGDNEVKLDILGDEVAYAELYSDQLFCNNPIQKISLENGEELLFYQNKDKLVFLRDDLSALTTNNKLSIIIQFDNAISMENNETEILNTKLSKVRNAKSKDILQFKNFISKLKFEVVNGQEYLEVFTEEANGDKNLLISDLNGRKIDFFNSINEYTKIDISGRGYKTGIYLVSLIGRDQIITKKVLIQR